MEMNKVKISQALLILISEIILPAQDDINFHLSNLMEFYLKKSQQELLLTQQIESHGLDVCSKTTHKWSASCPTSSLQQLKQLQWVDFSP